VVKHVHAVELRVVVAEVLAVAADAVLVAQHLLQLGAHLVTALARLHVQFVSREVEAWRRGARGIKKGGEERRNVRKSVWKFCTENKKIQETRARVSRTG
jgi:hypothetical protein